MEIQRMSMKQISIKAQNKKEMYRLLQLEAEVNLPPIQQTNRRYIGEVVSEKKKVSPPVYVKHHLKNNQIKFIQILHLQGLCMCNILDFSRKNIDIDQYLPVFKFSVKVLDRSWIWNISKLKAFSYIIQFFGSNWVQSIHHAVCFEKWESICNIKRRWDRSITRILKAILGI